MNILKYFTLIIINAFIGIVVWFLLNIESDSILWVAGVILCLHILAAVFVTRFLTLAQIKIAVCLAVILQLIIILGIFLLPIHEDMIEVALYYGGFFDLTFILVYWIAELVQQFYPLQSESIGMVTFVFVSIVIPYGYWFLKKQLNRFLSH
ncbi:MAG: hypothetical protein LBR25_07550 [Erysipelotrichaceae bacterium]|nr:hypothetical protein [Erysipelotrichaceae bacterium]